MSKGCHQLIKQGAKLVDCLQDIVEELDLINVSESVAETSDYSDNKTPPQNSLLTLMGYEPITLENIVHLSGLTVSEVSSMLMLLELEGRVASLAGGQYQKIM
jgi:DNA processing protein